MDYPFENLGPDRFQQFCQALLTRRYPNLQSFPVRQPDGGRDALRYVLEDQSQFFMYQVKFVTDVEAKSAPHKWLETVMQGEAPKIKAQIPKGAKEYVVITNVAGTGHLNTGSIDKIRESLRDTLGIPVTCLWRDDLARQLDGEY